MAAIKLNENGRELFEAIYTETGGDTSRTAGMWALGEARGLDRGATEDLCMELVSEGLLEIKNLSGGLGLTEQGAAAASEMFGGSGSGGGGSDPAEILDRLADACRGVSLPADRAGDLALDVEMLRLLARRNSPLPAASRAVLADLRSMLPDGGDNGAGTVLDELENMI